MRALTRTLLTVAATATASDLDGIALWPARPPCARSSGQPCHHGFGYYCGERIHTSIAVASEMFRSRDLRTLHCAACVFAGGNANPAVHGGLVRMSARHTVAAENGGLGGGD